MNERNFLLPAPETDTYTRLREEARPLVLYGMGNGADKLLDRLDKIGKRPCAVFASDDFVRGQIFRGYPVEHFNAIRQRYPSCVILLSFGTRVPEVMQHIRSLAEAYPLIMPDMPVAGETDFDLGFYRAHKAELQCFCDLLQDNLSKEILSHVIQYKLSGDIRYLWDGCTTFEEDRALWQSRPISHVVDGGAYRGDTAQMFLASYPALQCLYAIEPDRRNYRALESFVLRANESARIRLYRGALWSHSGTAVLDASGNRNSTLFAGSHQHKVDEVPYMTVDDIVGSDPVDLIKYDVEGAEAEALLGSARTIQRHHPVLAVSLYHRSEDLFRLPQMIHQLDHTYRFYLRRRLCLPAWELMLYAI